MNNLMNILCTSVDENQWLQPAVIAAIIAAAVTLPSIIMNIINFRISRIQSKRKEFYTKLSDFYGPMRMLLKTSREFSILLKKDKAQHKKEDETDFRVLTFLMRGEKFDKTGQALLEKIIYDGKKMESIIIKNAGLIDDDGLHLELNQLLTHIRLIRMANENKFETGIDKEKLFKTKVFPKIVNDVINLKFTEFKYKLDKLNKDKSRKELKILKNRIKELEGNIDGMRKNSNM